jgi:hypothetical protein
MQLILHSHPRIAIPPENRFVLPIYRRRQRFGDLTKRRNRVRLARAIVGHKGGKFKDFGLDAEVVQDAIVAAPPTLGSAIGTVVLSYAEMQGTPWWGDKRPGYVTNLGAVMAMFPDAQIVHMIRDGRDVVSSLKTMPWWDHGTVAAMATWAHSVDSGRRAAARYGAGSYYEVRYERLVADPEPELRRLCAFLGEDFDEAMLEPQRMAATAVPERKTWHVNTAHEISTAAVGRWSELEPDELGLAEHVLRRRLTRLGYELSGQGTSPSLRDRVTFGRELLRRKSVATKRARAAGRNRADVAARLGTSLHICDHRTRLDAPG